MNSLTRHLTYNQALTQVVAGGQSWGRNLLVFRSIVTTTKVLVTYDFEAA